MCCSDGAVFEQVFEQVSEQVFEQVFEQASCCLVLSLVASLDV